MANYNQPLTEEQQLATWAIEFVQLIDKNVRIEKAYKVDLQFSQHFIIGYLFSYCNEKTREVYLTLDYTNFVYPEFAFLFLFAKKYSREGQLPLSIDFFQKSVAAIKSVGPLMMEMNHWVQDALSEVTLNNNLRLKQAQNIVDETLKGCVDYLLDVAKKEQLNKALADTKQLTATASAKETIYQLELKLKEIMAEVREGGSYGLSDLVALLEKKINLISENPLAFKALPTGYQKLDQVLHGFDGNKLIIIAGRPGKGKTTFVLNLAYKLATYLNATNPAEKNNQAIAVFSLEMNNEELINKLVNLADPNERGYNIRTAHNWNHQTKANFLTAINQIKNLKIFIDDDTSLTIEKIGIKIEQLVRQYDLKAVIIDYLQLVRTKKNDYNNRVQEVSEVSRQLKLIAKKHNITVIAAAQLSRKIEERKGKNSIPLLSDLRESGSIEQDADVVLSLFSKEVETVDFEQNEDVALYVLKNRFGPTGVINFTFNKSLGKFEEKN